MTCNFLELFWYQYVIKLWHLRVPLFCPTAAIQNTHKKSSIKLKVNDVQIVMGGIIEVLRWKLSPFCVCLCVLPISCQVPTHPVLIMLIFKQRERKKFFIYWLVLTSNTLTLSKRKFNRKKSFIWRTLTGNLCIYFSMKIDWESRNLSELSLVWDAGL